MEIEEMHALWSDMSDQLEQQKKLTNEIILNMTQERYSNKFRTITNYETFGALICFAIGIYIIINFGALDTWYLKACGVFTIAFLFIIPVLVLRALKRIKQLNILNNNFKETMISYTKAKTNLLQLQKFAIMSSFILMFAVSAVFSKLWSNKDFFMMERNIVNYVSIGLAILFVVFISIWGYRHYTRITNSAETVLKELD